MGSKLKYLYFGLAIILMAIIVYALPTTYNPFTGKLDYYGVKNFTCQSNYVVHGFDANSSGVCIATPAGTEADPIFSANFTNMKVDCPNGNYTYGILGNGTLKCRSDTGGTITETDPVWTGNFSLGFYLNHTLAVYNNWGKWFYNMTTPAIDDTNSRFWNRTQAYNKTDIDIQIITNGTYFSTFNDTYNTWAYNMTTPAINYANSNFHNKSANIVVGNYNVTVSTNYTICLNGLACTKYIMANDTAIIIQS
jgi:hypothetical protein